MIVFATRCMKKDRRFYDKTRDPSITTHRLNQSSIVIFNITAFVIILKESSYEPYYNCRLEVYKCTFRLLIHRRQWLHQI